MMHRTTERSSKVYLNLSSLTHWTGLVVLTLALGACSSSQKNDEQAREQAEFDRQAAQARAADTSGQSGSDRSSTESTPAVEEEAVDSAQAEAREQAQRDARTAALEDAVRRAREGEMDSAKTDLQQLLDDPELGPHAAFNLGVIAYYQGEERTARRDFEAALTKDPTFGPAASAIVREYLRTGNESAARQFMREQLVASDNAPSIMAVGLMIPLRNKQYEEVITRAREIFMMDPSNLDAHYALALANMGLERYELAKYILQQGLTRDPDRIELKFALSRLAMIEGNTVRARNLLVEVLEKAPNHPEANNNLGVINIQTSNIDEAIENLERATRSAPWFADAWLNLGDAYKQQRRYEDAKNAFIRSSRLNTSSGDPYFNLAILYMDVPDFDRLDRIGRMETALDYFAQYRDLAGNLPPDHRVFEYMREANQIIETQRQLDRDAVAADAAAAEAAERAASGVDDVPEDASGDETPDGDGDSDDGFGDFEW